MALMAIDHFILSSELTCGQRSQLLLLAPLISGRGFDPVTTVPSLAGFTVLVATSLGIDLDGAEALGGRTGDLGSGFGIPSEPCVEALSAVPGREDAVDDRDAIVICRFGKPMSLGGKTGLAFLIGRSTTTSNDLFLGMFFGMFGTGWFGFK